MIHGLKAALDAAFNDISKEFQSQDIRVLMPTCAPQQGRLLSDFAKAGGKANIAGGKKGSPAFKNVRQYGLNFDTTVYLNIFPAGMCEQLVGAVPENMLKDKKIALFSFIPPAKLWASYIAERGLNTEIVATNEQNTRQFFERKGNLVHILQDAGLDAYVIPTRIVQPGHTDAELTAIYDAMKNEHGKVVVQPCVENYETTMFFDNVQDFLKRMKETDAPLKVVRFVTGSEANLTFLAGNTRPADAGRGVTKVNLPEGMDIDDPANLALIEANAAQAGIDASNAFSITGRATLKVVGDSLLAQARCDSVGNNMGHVYDDATSAQIKEIGEKLGHKMAMCGKVGLAGADLIIDTQGKIWINEINDRQQGPTDQMSADAEKINLPGLSRIAWFMHYGDFTQDKNVNLVSALSQNTEELHALYSKSEGSFYIKVYATHDAEHDGEVEAKIDMPAGVYNVSLVDGVWEWEGANDNVETDPIHLDAGTMTVKISDGSLSAGDKPLSGSEMFRITGVAEGANSPFIIENGISRLNPKWAPIISQLYKDSFGDDYLEKSALLKPDAPAAKDAAPTPKKLAKAFSK